MSDADLPPVAIGVAGLTGRTQIVRVPDEYEPPGEGEPPLVARKSMPPNCLRTMNSPLPPDRGGGCRHDCPGKQRDGGCLLDVVRAANAAGVQWQFEVDPHDHYWDYAGDPIPGFETVRGDFGQIHTRWQEGFEPSLLATKVPEVTSFVCPHCGETNEQDLANFHWWCAHCGKNAKEGIVGG